MQHLDLRIADVPEQVVLEGAQTLLSWLPALRLVLLEPLDRPLLGSHDAYAAPRLHVARAPPRRYAETPLSLGECSLGTAFPHGLDVPALPRRVYAHVFDQEDEFVEEEAYHHEGCRFLHESSDAWSAPHCGERQGALSR